MFAQSVPTIKLNRQISTKKFLLPGSPGIFRLILMNFYKFIHLNYRCGWTYGQCRMFLHTNFCDIKWTRLIDFAFYIDKLRDRSRRYQSL